MKLFAWLASAVVSAHRMDVMTHEQAEANYSNQIDITPWHSFNLHSPNFGVISASDTTQPQVFHIVERPRFGKLADYNVYYAGAPGAPLPQPILLYSHDNKFIKLDANIKSAAGKPLFEWRAYHWPTMFKGSTAFVTSPGKGMGRETYYSMTQLTKLGASKASRNGKLGQLGTSWLSTAETFTIDSGRCPKNGKSQCGRRIYNAQGNKMGSWMRIYSPDSNVPVAQSVKLQRKRTILGFADMYELTVAPGHDGLLLSTFASFIDSANNIEATQD